MKIAAVLILGFLLTPTSLLADYKSDSYSSSSSKKKSSKSKLALGLASNAHILYTTEAGLTGQYKLGRKSALQMYFIVQQSDPNLYSLGLSYKRTISGSQTLGFHVGGGLGLGTYADSKNFMHLVGIAGLHFTVSKRILFHFDGGLTLTNDDSPGNSTKTDSQYIIGGHSALLGMSVMYKF